MRKLSQTTRTVKVPDELGAIGFRLAADLLEAEADRFVSQPIVAVSFQQVADWLRHVAVQGSGGSVTVEPKTTMDKQ